LVVKLGTGDVESFFSLLGSLMNDELVSIITPLYNGANTIGDCYETVTKQTYKDWEWILVDDGSSDCSCEIVEPWLSDKIRILKTSRRYGGPGGPRNLAVENSSGRFVALLDQDDMWVEEKLERQVEHFREEPDLLLIGGNQIVFGEKQHKRTGTVIFRRKRSFRPSADEIFSENPFLASTAMFTRQAWQLGGGFDDSPLAIGRDEWDLWIRIASKGPVAYYDEVVGYYRWHEENLSHCMDQENSTDYIREKLRDLISPMVYRNAVSKDYYIKAKDALRRGDKDRFLRNIHQASELRSRYWFKGTFYRFQHALSKGR